jgi:hypothetical protein
VKILAFEYVHRKKAAMYTGEEIEVEIFQIHLQHHLRYITRKDLDAKC